MKLNMILRKRHIALAALVLALGVAVYLNWEFMSASGKNISGGEASAVSAEAGGESGNEDVATYGEAYFAEAKLSRTTSRDEAVDALKYMLEGADLDDATKLGLTEQALAIAEAIESEGKMENLIKAKGFEDCMVYLEDDRVDVIVKSDGLTDSEAAQIMDIVITETGMDESGISIIEIK